MRVTKTDDELAKQLWALGDVVRLRLLALLPQTAECCEGMNVSQLAEKLEMSQPTVSHHLRILRQAGIIESTKQCRDVYYYVNVEEAQMVLDSLSSAFLEKA
ncbi:helix-turn-helix domain-containing protein [Rubellicoccus peritrichatus]|uniref:Helix-turn-helix domain-containing protein n=1 Tax=Rubellicoccus peritrichatus TaxID=3080537 RepID=A0AAQ3QS48_9BACT|nr:helix-turn-helix domain-containing protein [Puniceicoccus sp. CR14]WOO39976.1 helix-turn-helix domain-containing protein [Puniceicoccus sp. CR14]